MVLLHIILCYHLSNTYISTDMIDINYIKENTKIYKENLKNRNMDPQLVDELLAAVKIKNEKQKEIEEINRERNENADKLKSVQDKRSPEAQSIIEEGKRIKEKSKEIEGLFNQANDIYQSLILKMPNVYTNDTPIGKDESENKPIRRVGDIPEFSFTAKEHFELGENLDLFDNERAAKVTGARFTYLKRELVLLEFALMQFAIDTLTNVDIIDSLIKKNNLNLKATPFIPILPPVFIRPDVMQKMGRLEPRDDRYHTEMDDLYLIGSAEHTLGSMHMDETFEENELPLRYVGYSTAFRREAGSYGKDMKGFLRMHQFNKMEMEVLSTPETSEDEQTLIVAIQEYFMQSLKLPYQVVAICTGDMGDPDARQIDIETWLPGQNKYRETHTSDLMTDYQSRRLNIKVKRQNGETQFVHMNDATAFSERPLIAIMENYQKEDGSIEIPEILQKYIPNKISEINKNSILSK